LKKEELYYMMQTVNSSFALFLLMSLEPEHTTTVSSFVMVLPILVSKISLFLLLASQIHWHQTLYLDLVLVNPHNLSLDCPQVAGLCVFWIFPFPLYISQYDHHYTFDPFFIIIRPSCTIH
jgi:hypothetical protein